MPPTPYLGFGFPPATPNKGLTTSDMPLTRRLILQKARHRPQKGSDGLSTHGFRNYFTPLPGYFSPFPHGTNPLSVIGKKSDLPDGPGRFTADSTSPLLLGDTTHTATHTFHVRDSHPLRQAIPHHFRYTRTATGGKRLTTHADPTTPHTTPQPRHQRCMQFSQKFAFVRHYSQNHNCFLLTPGTKMFHFPDHSCLTMNSPDSNSHH